MQETVDIAANCSENSMDPVTLDTAVLISGSDKRCSSLGKRNRRDVLHFTMCLVVRCRIYAMTILRTVHPQTKIVI